MSFQSILRPALVVTTAFAAVVILSAPTALAGGPVPDDCKPTPPNGCGPADSFISDKAIRDNYGKVHFAPACTNHDNCYNDPNKTQDQCDDAFYDTMVAECDVTQWYEWPACMAAAWTYYEAVHWAAGLISFNDSHQCALKHQAHTQFCATHQADCGATSSTQISTPAQTPTMTAKLTPSGPFAPGQPATFHVDIVDSKGAAVTNATTTLDDNSDSWVGNGNHTMTPWPHSTTVNGHTVFRQPFLKITAPGHAQTAVVMNVALPKLTITRTPDTGLTNCTPVALTITAKDAATGALVNGTVLVDGQPAGATGSPVQIRPVGVAPGAQAVPSRPGSAVVAAASSGTCDAPEIWIRAAGYPDALVFRPVHIQGTQVTTRETHLSQVHPPISTAVQRVTNIQQTSIRGAVH